MRLLKTKSHPERLDAIVEILSEANLHHPLWRYVFPEEFQRMERLIQLNKVRIQLLGERSKFWLDTDGRVAGHIAFAASNCALPSIWELIKVGFLTFPCRWGIASFIRFNRLMNGLAEKESLLLDHTAKTWLLEAFAIRSDLRGKGMGSDLLKALIMTKTLPGARTVLLCQEPAAHSFYLRLGFTDIGHHHEVSLKPCTTVPCWAMEFVKPTHG